MKTPVLSLALGAVFLAALAYTGSAAVITVTTKENVNPPAGQTSLLQAMKAAKAGDTIAFNIPGTGPFYIATPPEGYPLITANGLTIDGYTQPGSSPNTNPILGANNAKLMIVLDSRNGNFTSMNYQPDNSRGAGYDDSEFAILGVFRAENVTIRGLSLLGKVPAEGDNSNYGISFARDYEGTANGGHISGCWIGLDPDGKTLSGTKYAITVFRHRNLDNQNPVLVTNLTVGVKKGSANPRAEFNLILQAAIPMIIEGEAPRISGNFIGVFPDGLHDYNVASDPAYTGDFQFEGAIEIGRGNNNTVIGVDGDGVNDADERNVIGGTLPPSLNGYDHTIEFYGNTPGTNIVIAGNYIGVGIDGTTAFTNGVPAINASGGASSFRIGSNFDGVSDNLEGNVIANYFPADVIGLVDLAGNPGNLSFFDEISTTGTISFRGNSTVNDFPFPVSPLKVDGGVEGAWLTTYYSRVMLDSTLGVFPELSTNTTVKKLVGKAPVGNTDFPVLTIDLYAADPAGIQTGIDLAIPGLTNGFVQGKAYIASFVDNSAADLNKKAGEFEFDLSAVELKGTLLTVTANYSTKTASDPTAKVITGPFSAPVEVQYSPGSIESVGLRRIVADTPIILPAGDALGNWEPNASVLGTSTFLIEGNTFAEGTTDSQRYVIGFQPAAGGAYKQGEAIFADNGQPFKGIINASRQNGNPGRVAGDKRPGAVNFVSGVEASPHVYAEFASDNRWTLGFDRLVDGRYGVVQGFSLDPATLAQKSLFKATDSALGRLTSGAAPGNQISRFGGDVVFLDNGNFVSVVEDRSLVFRPDGNAAVATIFTPAGAVVKDSFLVANGDLWSNVAAYKGGFAVRVVDTIYFYDNAGNLKGKVNQDTSNEKFSNGRGDGTRIAGHINSPYVFLTGKVTTGPLVKVAAFDATTFTAVGVADVSEGAFAGQFDRANLAVDALNRVVVSWVAQPTGYEAQQVAARVLEYLPASKSFKALTASFLPFVNTAKTGGIRTLQMSIATTTKQILVAAKGEINLQNKPDAGVNSPREVNFFTVISHPAPKEDPTTPVGGGTSEGKLSIAKAGANVSITWTGSGFVLQSAPTVTGAWTTVTTTGNSHTATPGGAAAFYRLSKP